MRKSVYILLFILISVKGYSQTFFDKSDIFNKKRTIFVSGINTFNWGASIGGLYFVWYKNLPKTKFHFFNDANEWQQMDKLGHLTVSYNFAKTSADLYEWAGIDSKKASLIGAGYAFAYMFTFEMLDAFNEKWGFSVPDIIANTSGICLFSIQDYFWNEQFITPKFSSHLTSLASLRPDVLGGKPIEQLFKDYNGQTYWLSFNPFYMLKKSSKIPHWLSLSFGYSINNQLIGNGDTFVYLDGTEQTSFTPYKQFYFSLDIDWEKIPIKNPYLKILFRGLNIIKIPFPAIEFSKYGVKGYGVYF
ncbi:MAG TPA: DUF2279 domain-containing protein [Crocinitomix sp.]|nr:DUF2279 domain-containing protein [Crocinitomix sp.]